MKTCFDTLSPCGWAFSNQHDVSSWLTMDTLTVRSRLRKTFRWLDLNSSAHTNGPTLTSRNDEEPAFSKRMFHKQPIRLPSNRYWLSFLNTFRVKATARFFLLPDVWIWNHDNPSNCLQLPSQRHTVTFQTAWILNLVHILVSGVSPQRMWMLFRFDPAPSMQLH
jgi:hypothetical protein